MHATNDKPEIRRILAVANETVEGATLIRAVCALADSGRAEVLVVVPALNSRLRYWTSDEDGARRAAEARLHRCLAVLDRAGIAASGQVGDADPLLAIADALSTFAASEILISTHPERRSHWLSIHVVERARMRFPVPVLHVVVGEAAVAA
jgi:hypothetical protein